jgi:hypothetical protein
MGTRYEARLADVEGDAAALYWNKILGAESKTVRGKLFKINQVGAQDIEPLP